MKKLAALALAAFLYGCDSAPSFEDGQLLAHWSFNDEVTADNSGNGTEVSAFGAISDSAGVIGRAIQLNGSDYLVGRLGDRFMDDERAVSFWFKKAGNQITSDYESLMWQAGPGASGPSFVVDIRGATEPFDIRFSVMTMSDTLAYVTIPAAVTPGSWHHVTAVVDEAHLRLTVDQSASDLTLMTDGVQKSEAPIYFGRVDDGGNSPRFFNGHLDEIRLYRKTLSQPDINLLFAEGNR